MRSILMLSCLMLAWLCPSRALASEGPPPKLDPKTYLSPSGEYSLLVNPSDQYGVGPAKCTLKRRAEVVWTKSIPFSFWEAAVTNDGRAAGYAYSHGYQGWGAPAGYGDLIVALLAADGTEIERETTPRTDTGQFICPPDRQPSPRGFVIQPDLNRFAIRLVADPGNFAAHGERWLLYSLATGKRTGDLALASPGPAAPADAGAPAAPRLWHMAVDADAVPGTELTLVLWARTNWRPNNTSDEGARLSLIDKDAKEIWSREWPTEFAGVQYFTPWYLKDNDVTPAARFTVGRFVYRSFKQQAALAFTVAKGADGTWKVEDAGSTPEAVKIGRWGEAAPALPPAQAGAPALEQLGTISLGAGEPDDNLNIFEFSFDDRSRCGFSHSTPDGGEEFVLITTDVPDAVKAAVRVPLDVGQNEKRSISTAAWVGGDRWVVVQGSYDDAVPTRGWIVDAGTGKAAQIADFNCPKLATGRSVVGGGEHGFAVLGGHSVGGVTRFDSTGKRRDTLLPNGRVEDVCFRPDGSMGMLINISYVVLTFDPSGKQTGQVGLAQGFGDTPQYVTNIDADENGGWIVHDFPAKPAIYRLTASNTLRASFTPHFADGRTFRLYGGVHRAPNGRLWTSDRAALLRLADDGAVDLVLGTGPDSDALQEIRAAAVDHAGRIYALDGHTGLTHVFDSTGKRVRLLRPDPKDFPTDCGLGSMTVGADGEVYCRPSSNGLGESRYLHFDASGKRVGFEPKRSGEVCDEWFFRPGGKDSVVLGYERAFLYDAEGQRSRTLERRADDLWLSSPQHAAVAPDGSFAILARPSSRTETAGPSVTLFSAAGDAMKTVEIPGGGILARVAASNRTVAVLSGTQLLCIDRASGKSTSYTVPDLSAGKSWTLPFFSPDGTEIWALDVTDKKLTRFRAPVGE